MGKMRKMRKMRKMSVWHPQLIDQINPIKL